MRQSEIKELSIEELKERLAEFKKQEKNDEKENRTSGKRSSWIEF